MLNIFYVHVTYDLHSAKNRLNDHTYNMFHIYEYCVYVDIYFILCRIFTWVR